MSRFQSKAEKKSAKEAMNEVLNIRHLDFDQITDNIIEDIRDFLYSAYNFPSLHGLDLLVSDYLFDELQRNLTTKTNKDHCCLGSCFRKAANSYGSLNFCEYHDHIGKMHDLRHKISPYRLISLCLVKDDTPFDHVKCAVPALKLAFAEIYDIAMEEYNVILLERCCIR